MKKITLIIISILLILLSGKAVAGEIECRENIIDEVDFFGFREYDFENLTDSKNTTLYYLSTSVGENYIGFYNDSKKTISHVYIKWVGKPSTYTLQKSSDGNIYEDIVCVDSAFLSDLLEIQILPGEYFRINIKEFSGARFAIEEIQAYENSDLPLPTSVQNWREAPQKADMMIFSAHSDDEWVFFGGAIPKYSVQEQKETIVVYMAADKSYRKSEALSSLWSAGLTTYPIFAPFQDEYNYSLDETMAIWGEDDTIRYCVRLIRRYRPDVILTHDFDGEYGHGNHKMTAYSIDNAVIYANDPTYDTQSVEEFGVWNVKKLYIHLYEENQIEIDYNQPLEAYDGLSAYDVSKNALKNCFSQMEYTGLVYVHEGEEYSCAKWGLRYTSVGNDILKTTFFENIGQEEDSFTVSPSLMPEVTLSPELLKTPSVVTIEPTAIIETDNAAISEQTDQKNNMIVILLAVYSLVATVLLFYITIRRKKEKRKN